jgi:hypothetical protein
MPASGRKADQLTSLLSRRLELLRWLRGAASSVLDRIARDGILHPLGRLTLLARQCAGARSAVSRSVSERSIGGRGFSRRGQGCVDAVPAGRHDWCGRSRGCRVLCLRGRLAIS